MFLPTRQSAALDIKDRILHWAGSSCSHAQRNCTATQHKATQSIICILCIHWSVLTSLSYKYITSQVRSQDELLPELLWSSQSVSPVWPGPGRRPVPCSPDWGWPRTWWSGSSRLVEPPRTLQTQHPGEQCCSLSLSLSRMVHSHWLRHKDTAKGTQSCVFMA